MANGSSRCPEQTKNDQLKLAAWHETHLAVKPSLELRESKARNFVLVILLEMSLRGLRNGRASMVDFICVTTPGELGWSVRKVIRLKSGSAAALS